MSKYLLFLTGVGGWSGKDGPLVQIYNLFSNHKWTLHSAQSNLLYAPTGLYCMQTLLWYQYLQFKASFAPIP